MKINLLEIYEDIYKGKKKSHSPVVSLIWSFSGLSSRLENLAHIPRCSMGS